MSALSFEVVSRGPGLARAGLLTLPHGVVETPVFMPVGTKATVKGLMPEDLEAMGAQIILANTYHLAMRPGADLVAEMGGLHGFSTWKKPFLTDSGGFQVFSLGWGKAHGVGKLGSMFPGEGPSGAGAVKNGEKLCVVDNEGVTFRSHIDGTKHRFTPEVAIALQEQLGADVILAFDECTSPLHDEAYTAAALKRTHAWAERCLAAKTRPDQALFGIVQGGAYEGLRHESTRTIGGMGFDGFAIGGSLGSTKAEMHHILEWVNSGLPENKPRHLLGIGEPEDLFEGVARGVDMFDCVGPSRQARHGSLYTPDGKLSIRNLSNRSDQGPIDPSCSCPTCAQGFSRGYLRHLFLSDELLFYRLATLHNLHFVVQLVKRMRQALIEGHFEAFKAEFLARYLRTTTP